MNNQRAQFLWEFSKRLREVATECQARRLATPTETTLYATLQGEVMAYGESLQIVKDMMSSFDLSEADFGLDDIDTDRDFS